MVDSVLSSKYRKMLGIDNIKSISGTTLIEGDVTILSNLNVSGYGYIGADTFVNSNVNISGNMIINGDTVVENNLHVNDTMLILENINSNNISISNNTTILGTIYISGTTIINGNTTIMNNFFIENDLICDNLLQCDNIIGKNDTISIIGNIINIGNSNSVINILGTTYYGSSNDFIISDKLISLNINKDTGLGIDIGNNSGIELYSNLGNGYIKTNNTADRFIIRPPGKITDRYIATVDLSNNLNVSNDSVFYQDVTILSSLYVSGDTVISNNCTIGSTLNVNNEIIFNNDVTVNSNIIGSDGIFNNISINNNLYVSNNSIIYGNATINGIMYVSGNISINNDSTILSNINVSGSAICNGTLTIGSSLTVDGSTIINNNLTINSDLFVNGDTIINGNATILSNINISNDSVITGSVTVSNNLYISGNSFINGNVFFGTTSSIINILGDIITDLLHFDTNTSAANAGIPIWGLYRTGGIIKVRLDDVPPLISLTGNTTININQGNSFIEPGIISYDDLDGNVDSYITSISSINTNNIILSPIKITQSSLINQTNTLPIDFYTVIYYTEDSVGNYSTALRYINIQ